MRIIFSVIVLLTTVTALAQTKTYKGKLKVETAGTVLVINPGQLNQETIPLLGISADNKIQFDDVDVTVTGKITKLKGRAIALKVTSIKSTADQK